MAQERLPATQLETRQKTLSSQNQLLGTLLTKLNTLQDALGGLADADSINPSTAASSSSNVLVSAGSAATPGTYNLVVSQLARSQVMASSSTYSSLTDVAATAGSLTFTPATGDPVTVTLSGSTTLTGLAAAINNTEDIPVTASVVQTAPGTYKLVLTGKETGAPNAFTVTSTLSGGAGVTFTDTDGDNTYGDSAADLVQSALNASFTVNGLAVQSASNIVTGAVPGATLTLKKQDPSETVTVSVSRDEAEATSRIQAFMDAYNGIVLFMKEQDAADLAGRASLAKNPLLRGFRNNFRTALQANHPEAGTFTTLAQIGIGFDRTGKMTLDKDAFKTASTTSLSSVQTLLSGADGDGGVIGALVTAVTDYTEAGGLLSTARDRLTQQVKDIGTRLDALDARLAVRRLALQKEFLEADRLMQQLNSQGSSLSQLGVSFQRVG